MGGLPDGGPRAGRTDRGRRWRRPLALPVAAAAAGALTLAACGGDDGGAVSSVAGGSDPSAEGDAAVASTTATGGDTAPDPEALVEDAPHTCDTIDADLIGRVLQETGQVAGAVPSGADALASFIRPDGTEFSYMAPGCRYIVAAPGGEHRVTISSAAHPEGVDLFDEWWATIDSGEREQLEGVGDGAFLDNRFGDQSVTLVVDAGDRVLFVKSQPPSGEPLLGRNALVALAGVALAASGGP